MKYLLSRPGPAAIASLFLAMPLGLTYAILMLSIEPLARGLNNLFAVDGQQGEPGLNALGRIVIYGGLMLLPLAFALNLWPLLKQRDPEGKTRLYPINLMVGLVILLLILVTWGGLLSEQIYCLRGIRCD